MLDETSPYIAGWFAVTVLTLMLLKYVYLGQGLDEQGEAEVRKKSNPHYDQQHHQYYP